MFVYKKLKICREAKELSLRDLMYEIYPHGIRKTQETFRNWERGAQTPDANALEIFAKFYDKPLQYFFDKKGE